MIGNPTTRVRLDRNQNCEFVPFVSLETAFDGEPEQFPTFNDVSVDATSTFDDVENN